MVIVFVVSIVHGILPGIILFFCFETTWKEKNCLTVGLGVIRYHQTVMLNKKTFIEKRGNIDNPN